MSGIAPAAAWWRRLPNGQAACDLCPIGCRLREGQSGPCGTRANRGGVMRPLHYGRVATAALDPIEKKPLYHFHPGRDILSVAAPGCNLHCLFCQNWSLSQEPDAPTRPASPADLVAAARAQDSVGLAFTYSEPLVWYEFVRDAALAAREAGLAVVLVTNGYLNEEPLAELLPLVDAANIDLKAMDDAFYRRVCKARLAPVLAAIDGFLAAGVHVELTNLLIPGHNDAPEAVDRLVAHVAGLGRPPTSAPTTRPGACRRRRRRARRCCGRVSRPPRGWSGCTWATRRSPTWTAPPGAIRAAPPATRCSSIAAAAGPSPTCARAPPVPAAAARSRSAPDRPGRPGSLLANTSPERGGGPPRAP